MALMAFMMLAVAEKFACATHRRMEENLEVRILFSKALPAVEKETLKSGGAGVVHIAKECINL
jgi:hypothetical protein